MHGTFIYIQKLNLTNHIYGRYKRENCCDSREITFVIQIWRLTVYTSLTHCTYDIHAMIVMPLPLSVSQETIIIFVFATVLNLKCLLSEKKSPSVGKCCCFFCIINTGKSSRA